MSARPLQAKFLREIRASIRRDRAEDPVRNCSNRRAHTPSPDDYIGWHEWARRKMRQGCKVKLCPGCKRYTIWFKPMRARP